MDGFALSDIQIVVRKAPKPEVPMFEQTMSLLMMIKEQKVLTDPQGFMIFTLLDILFKLLNQTTLMDCQKFFSGDGQAKSQGSEDKGDGNVAEKENATEKIWR